MFVSLIHRVDHGVYVEGVGKVDVAKDVGVFVRVVIHIWRHLMVSTMYDFSVKLFSCYYPTKDVRGKHLVNEEERPIGQI